MSTFEQVRDLQREADRLLMQEPGDVEALEEVLSALREIDAAEPDGPASDALSQLAHMRFEKQHSTLEQTADKTLDSVDRNSWDYLDEDGKPTPADLAEEKRKERLKAFAKRHGR